MLSKNTMTDGTRDKPEDTGRSLLAIFDGENFNVEAYKGRGTAAEELELRVHDAGADIDAVNRKGIGYVGCITASIRTPDNGKDGTAVQTGYIAAPEDAVFPYNEGYAVFSAGKDDNWEPRLTAAPDSGSARRAMLDLAESVIRGNADAPDGCVCAAAPGYARVKVGGGLEMSCRIFSSDEIFPDKEGSSRHTGSITRPEGIRLEHVSFRRTVLVLEGSCPASMEGGSFFLFREKGATGTAPPQPEAWLSGQPEGKCVFFRVEDAEVCGERFHAEAPMMSCANGMPLPTGRWHLLAQDVRGLRFPVCASGGVYGRIRGDIDPKESLDLEIDKSAGNFFHAYSRTSGPRHSYCLDVEYRVPGKPKNPLQRWVRGAKARRKARRGRFRRKMFKCAFRFFDRHVKKTGRKVLFTSASRAELGGNEKAIYDRMAERGLVGQYDIKFDFRPSIKSRRTLKNKILFTYNLATADYIFLDDYQPEIYVNDYSPGVKVVQVWHACGAFKTIGFERFGAEGAPAFNSRAHRCYTHVLVSSDHSARHNAEAFGISRSRFYPVGVARTDVFFNRGYGEKARKNIYEACPQLKEASRVILYAPTFRGSGAKSAYFPVQKLDMRRIGGYLEKTGSVMVIKMHPFVKGSLWIPAEYSACFVDASGCREVNDFLFVTDILITDYSSVIYEASLLGIPMLFYAFDLEQYTAKRGFYEPYEDTVPGKIVKTLPALLDALERGDYEDWKLKGFVEKNFKYTDGKSADRAIDLIFGTEPA